MTACILYGTASNRNEIKEIAKILLSERLCACVNILGEIGSLYWWNDAVQDETETAFLIKTTEAKVEQVISKVVELHSYECPCIISLPIEKGAPDFLKWISEQTR